MIGKGGDFGEPAPPYPARDCAGWTDPRDASEARRNLQSRNISAQAQDRMQVYLEEMRQAGKNPDPAELAVCGRTPAPPWPRCSLRRKLEGISAALFANGEITCARISAELKYFNATPDEFRSIFRATDSIDQQLQLLGNRQ